VPAGDREHRARGARLKTQSCSALGFMGEGYLVENRLSGLALGEVLLHDGLVYRSGQECARVDDR
jgi:hypothetical protein